ncbi:MAG: hypothetical protein DI569_13420 [Sphingopyxis macrogoltabida]|uniref:Uncharacterized protein n=1 Tax=Sphingopyxis macrogoltabida TaxID=33050 RepID=A0A2W5KYF7_SPHMC|nr:MAG: hypothetical protein DI569_13420 [Sphingopyxis macrogoltabida]
MVSAAMTTDLTFCGREAEMAVLADCWRRASDVDDPHPQLLLLAAEPGVGKTRLVLEFLRRQIAAQPPEQAYWPDPATEAAGRLPLNFAADRCRFDRPIPFLWWGVAAQADGGDSVAMHDRFLAPHLVAMSMRARMAGTGVSLAKIWAGVGVDALAGALQVDTVLSVGSALFDSVKLLHGQFGGDTADIRLAGNMIVSNRVDALLADLEQVMNPAARLGYARVPALILIDDAQFAGADPGLLRFVERLAHAAITGKWPVMIVLTHWQTEWALESERGGRSVAAMIHHARHGGTDEPGPISGVPGGYLNSGHYREMRLAKLDDLTPALRAALPGLTAEQDAAILGAVDGNPRFLEQIIAYLRSEPRLFDDFDPARALTDDGLAEALSRSQRVHEVVLARLTAPHVASEVREALALASVQGMRVLRDVVEAAGHSLLGHDLGEPLMRGQNPFSIMAFEDGGAVGSFTERLFLQAASQLRRNIKGLHDEAAVKAALRLALAAILRAPVTDTETRDAAALVALRLVDGGADDRGLTALAAATHMLALDEPEPMRAALAQFLAALDGADGAAADAIIADISHAALLGAADNARLFDRADAAAVFADHRIAAIRRDRGGPASQSDLADWLALRGAVHGAFGQFEEATARLDEAVACYRDALVHAPSRGAVTGLHRVLTLTAQDDDATGHCARADDRIDILLDTIAWAQEQGLLSPNEAEKARGAALSLRGHMLLQRNARSARSGGDIRARMRAQANRRPLIDASLDEAEAIARRQSDRGDIDARRNLSAALNARADRRAMADADDAIAASNESVAIMRDLIAATPRVSWLRDLAVALTVRSRVAQARGEPASDDLAEALDLMKQVESRLMTDNARADVAASIRNIEAQNAQNAPQLALMGQQLLERRDLAGAFAAYRAAVAAVAPLYDRTIAPPLLMPLYQSALTMLALAPHFDPLLDADTAEQVMLEGFHAALAFLNRKTPDAVDGIAEAGAACAQAYGDADLAGMFASMRKSAGDLRQILADDD